jgi:hypothetical protein
VIGVARDISGKKFARLTAIKNVGVDKNKNSLWEFRCDCGVTVIALKGNVTSGKTSSCGCLRNERIREANSTHGLSGSRLYKIWGNMVHRCHNSTDARYQDYGGRGIRVCAEWLNNPAAFVSWALLNGYGADLTLERQDNDKGYCPDNCRWTTREAQTRNKRSNHVINTPLGVMCIVDAAKRAGVKCSTLRNRIWNGKPYDDLLTGMIQGKEVSNAST